MEGVTSADPTSAGNGGYAEYRTRIISNIFSVREHARGLPSRNWPQYEMSTPREICDMTSNTLEQKMSITVFLS